MDVSGSHGDRSGRSLSPLPSEPHIDNALELQGQLCPLSTCSVLLLMAYISSSCVQFFPD